MRHWQDSRLDARQNAIYSGACTFGHSFGLTLKDKKTKRAVTKGLSALRTSALFEDPANDITPYAALHVTDWPQGETPGYATMWDGRNEYAVRFVGLDDAAKVVVANGRRHGATECPVTRFAASVDLDGRTVGVVEPMIPLQNRINQTVFDLLVTQSYASFKVRYATGMAPPLKRDAQGDPLLDANGHPIPLPINHNAKRFLFAEDDTARFGTLDETPLDGFIASIEASIRHLAAISQTPPHHLLGQIANLSAEALLAAETALARKVEAFRKSFGESWERVFNLAAELNGDDASASDFAGEVLWRDMENRSLAQSADALGKLAEALEIPKQGLWNRVPGATSGEIASWKTLKEQQPDVLMADALSRSIPDPASLTLVEGGASGAAFA
jgi:hypothetical protein